MASRIQLRRGPRVNLPQLASGEPGICTDAGAEEAYFGNAAGNANIRLLLAREYGAQSVLVAVLPGTPVATTIAASQVLGRGATGDVGPVSMAVLWSILSGAAGADVSMNSRRLTSVLDPTGAQDAATKAYVDAVAVGLQPKTAVACATTVNITLSGEQTIDGVLTSASRVLVKNQTNQTQNGIYISAAFAWTRAADFDSSAEIPHSFVPVSAGGTVNGDTVWVCTNQPEAAIPGTNDVTFTRLPLPAATSGANTSLSNLASVAINTALLPGGAAIADFGSAALPWRDFWLAGSSSTPGTNNFRITGASTGGTRTLTLPNLSGTVLTNVSPIDGGTF